MVAVVGDLGDGTGVEADRRVAVALGGSLALTTLNIGDTDVLDGGSIVLDQGTTGDIALDPGSSLTATGLTAGFTGAVLLADVVASVVGGAP